MDRLDRMKKMDIVMFALVVFGAINWGLLGIFDFNLVTAIFGGFTYLVRIVYTLIGIAGLYELFQIRVYYHRMVTAESHG
ncbi:MAG: hypothetical protein Kow0099_37640 [Candidatus Abyssubacteria bacterium]